MVPRPGAELRLDLRVSVLEWVQRERHMHTCIVYIYIHDACMHASMCTYIYICIYVHIYAYV